MLFKPHGELTYGWQFKYQGSCDLLYWQPLIPDGVPGTVKNYFEIFTCQQDTMSKRPLSISKAIAVFTFYPLFLSSWLNICCIRPGELLKHNVERSVRCCTNSKYHFSNAGCWTLLVSPMRTCQYSI